MYVYLQVHIHTQIHTFQNKYRYVYLYVFIFIHIIYIYFYSTNSDTLYPKAHLELFAWFLIIFSIKWFKAPWRNDWLQVWPREVQMCLEYIVMPESKKVRKKDGGMQQVPGINLKELSKPKAKKPQNIWTTMIGVWNPKHEINNLKWINLPQIIVYRNEGNRTSPFEYHSNNHYRENLLNFRWNFKILKNMKMVELQLSPQTYTEVVLTNVQNYWMLLPLGCGV